MMAPRRRCQRRNLHPYRYTGFFSCNLPRVICTFVFLIESLLGELSAGPSSTSRRADRRRRTRSPRPKIVNGKPAEAGSYPFFVTLYTTSNPETADPSCGGSLITPSVILTAAHCADFIEAVEYGRYDLDVDDEIQVRAGNLNRRAHPNFDEATFDNDYALIGINEPLENPFLVSLRRTPEIPRELSVMGFGALEDIPNDTLDDQVDTFYPTVLQEANVSRFAQDQCSVNYQPNPITANMFCANDADEGKDSCSGDSGGPIVVRNENVQVGIVSFGDGCGLPNFPGVYARIDTGFDWIQTTVCTDLSPDDCVNGILPAVDSNGAVVELDCTDKDSFLGLGKKLQQRNCSWVAEYPERRCRWYGELYCPETCDVGSCQNR